MFDIYQKVVHAFKNKDSFIILIDGYAGSGKTTFAGYLENELDATLIHMDDFYLPVKERKADWFEKAAGNIDFARLNNEIIIPYKNSEYLIINKFIPKTQELKKLGFKEFNPKLIIEGSYSEHPDLNLETAYKIFMKCDKQAQKDRLIVREKDNYVNFENTWIVKELNYHSKFNIEQNANIVIDTSELF